MNYEFKEISYPSTDGIHTIHAEIYFPKEKAPVGIVQIAHGMMDYVGRYTLLADALAEAGYVLAGNDHLGHGSTVATPAETPVQVLTKCAPASQDRRVASAFSSSVSRPVSMITFTVLPLAALTIAAISSRT